MYIYIYIYTYLIYIYIYIYIRNTRAPIYSDTIKNKKAVVAQRQAVIDRNYSSHWVAREYQMGEQVYIHIPYAKRKASKNPKPEGRLIAWGTEAVVLERGPASAPSFRVLFLNHGPSNELPSSISKVLYKWNDLMPVDGMGKVTLNPKALRFGQNILERVREMKQTSRLSICIHPTRSLV